MVMLDAVTIPLWGIALGIPLAFVTSRVAVNLLFGVQPGDPSSLVVTGVLMLVMAGVAALIPSLRATRTDPISVMRHE